VLEKTYQNDSIEYKLEDPEQVTASVEVMPQSIDDSISVAVPAVLNQSDEVTTMSDMPLSAMSLNDLLTKVLCSLDFLAIY